MAQLRQEYDEFITRNTEVVVAGPEGAKAFAKFWEKETLRFIGLPDPTHSVLKLYGQQVKIFKLGRMPAQVLIDKRRVPCVLFTMVKAWRTFLKRRSFWP